MSPSSSTPANQALSQTLPSERVFATRDHAALWFSLGVGLLVMQVGAYLLPALSTQQAVLAIVLGSTLGA
ncbi:MAG: allantoin permease, partial [Comamonas sp.]